MNYLPPQPPGSDSVEQLYQQYYSAPQRRRGISPWVWVLSGCVVLLFGGCGALVWLGIYSMRQSGMIATVPKAKVHSGTPIQWQELHSWKAGGDGIFGLSGVGNPFGMTGVQLAELDGDADPELLIVQPNTSMFNPGWQTDCQIIELDGTVRELTLGAQSNYWQIVVWDYDRDGIDELIGLGSGAEVFSAQGSRVATLPGQFMGGTQPKADIDGDGYVELLVHDYATNATSALGAKGQKAWSSTTITHGGAWAQVDSDPELEHVEMLSGSPSAVDMHGNVTTIAGWPGGYVYNFAVADVDGDGIDELIDPPTGFLNVATSTHTSLQQPPGHAGSSLNAGSFGSYMLTPQVAAGDFDGDGTRELALTGSSGNPGMNQWAGTALYLYRLDGSLAYYEEFGKALHGIVGFHDGTRDRLVVHLKDRLLISP